jgi:hypothetical protein
VLANSRAQPAQSSTGSAADVGTNAARRRGLPLLAAGRRALARSSRILASVLLVERASLSKPAWV